MSANISPAILQPAWGALSDRIGHNKLFVAFGTLTGLVTVYLFLWATSPLNLILLYTVESILLSIQIPTWLSLVGALIHPSKRGTELGRLGMVTNVAALLATVLAGYMTIVPGLMSYFRAWWGPLGPIMFPPVEAWREPYYLPFYLTAVTGLLAAVLCFTIKENPRNGNGKHGFPPMLKLLTRPGDFRRLCFTATFFSFAMSMAWPFFIIVSVVWLKMTLLQIAIASAVSIAFTVAFTVPLGKLSDRVGRRPLIFLGRAIYFLVPLLYILAVDATLVYVSNAVSGIASAASDNAATAYIYDVSPEGERGSHIAVYNTFTGVVFLFGSLISGIIGQAMAPLLGDYSAVFTMMMLSTVLRFVGSFVYLSLREPRAYASSFWTECRAFLYKRHTKPE